MVYRAKAVFLNAQRRRKERIMATWIVGGVLLVIVGAIIWKMIKDKKSGNSACSCGGDCGKCKGCH